MYFGMEKFHFNYQESTNIPELRDMQQLNSRS